MVAPPDLVLKPMDVLVAGCGTGREALSVARAFGDCRVLAIDLSRASLAYASQRAQELDVTNVTFHQGDILNVAALDRRFAMIVSSGVLHHMEAPAAGLAALRNVLLPGGLMMIALYSRAARAIVTTARRRIAERGLTPTPESIRAFRREVLAGGPDHPLAALVHSTDFYTLSGARDLVFHAHEQQFDLPEARTLLAGVGLELLGLQLADARVARAYRAENPDDPAMTDLERWHRYEERHRATFAGMVHLWCRKPER